MIHALRTLPNRHYGMRALNAAQLNNVYVIVLSCYVSQIWVDSLEKKINNNFTVLLMSNVDQCSPLLGEIRQQLTLPAPWLLGTKPPSSSVTSLHKGRLTFALINVVVGGQWTLNTPLLSPFYCLNPQARWQVKISDGLIPICKIQTSDADTHHFSGLFLRHVAPMFKSRGRCFIISSVLVILANLPS